MNPDKKKIGCTVPYCSHDWCNRKKKKFCALRRYFLLYQKEQRALQSVVFTSINIDKIKEKIYSWRLLMNNRDKRDNKIKKEIRILTDAGYKIKDAISITADKYFLASETVRDIWYNKR